MFCSGRPFAKRRMDLKPEQESIFVHRMSLHSALLPLLSACRFAEFDTSFQNLPCAYTFYRHISMIRYVLSLQVLAFEGKSLIDFLNMYNVIVHINSPVSNSP